MNERLNRTPLAGGWEKRAEEIWRGITEKRSNEDWVKWRLQWEDWESLGKDAVRLANQELRRRRWRGTRSGVAPRGYDAECLAWEAIGHMVEGKSRLVPGWTRERLLKELERMISGKVRLLNSLKETRAMRNEWDISPRKANGEPVSILSNVAGEGQTGYDALVEGEEGRESLGRRIEAELEGDLELKVVFRCLWEGETRTREIAGRLGMEEKAVVLARRRLSTRLKRWRATGLPEPGGTAGGG